MDQKPQRCGPILQNHYLERLAFNAFGNTSRMTLNHQHPRTHSAENHKTS